MSRLFIDQKIPAIEREQMPIVLTYLNEIVAIGELYVHEQFKDLITIKNDGDE